MSHMCVDATTRAANDLGYRTVTIHDACATRDVKFDGATAPLCMKWVCRWIDFGSLLRASAMIDVV
ncbi:hypothetical protein B2M20_17630 [Nitrobacter vulgaris]|uniref:Isochorismatase-like domain-containing protein n=1 Tax=Nitrobacter vulgaris TaxID=29421 RepID=A0A1V4HV77_NITVU|nr:hypothetical protein B2M20_17630 [Nitrobacter vulgaris]